MQVALALLACGTRKIHKWHSQIVRVPLADYIFSSFITIITIYLILYIQYFWYYHVNDNEKVLQQI